jgi:hypothetical protein
MERLREFIRITPLTDELRIKKDFTKIKTNLMQEFQTNFSANTHKNSEVSFHLKLSFYQFNFILKIIVPSWLKYG